MELLRTPLERLSRNRYIKRKIKVNGESVPLFVSPDSQLKYLKWGRSRFDLDLIQLAEKYLKEESVVWDIGANVGVFGLAAASIAKAGQVVAVEADIWLASLLRKSKHLRKNRKLPLIILPAAVSGGPGVESLLIARRGRASNALEKAKGHSQMGGVRERQYIPTITLDGMLDTFESPDFVKIDIEGAEQMALSAAKRLIEQVRPIFYIEVGVEYAMSIAKFFRQQEYQLFDPDGAPLSGPCLNNTLFIPKEKCELNL